MAREREIGKRGKRKEESNAPSPPMSANTVSSISSTSSKRSTTLFTLFFFFFPRFGISDDNQPVAKSFAFRTLSSLSRRSDTKRDAPATFVARARSIFERSKLGTRPTQRIIPARRRSCRCRTILAKRPAAPATLAAVLFILRSRARPNYIHYKYNYISEVFSNMI